MRRRKFELRIKTMLANGPDSTGRNFRIGARGGLYRWTK
jgi:hypothetical protein